MDTRKLGVLLALTLQNSCQNVFVRYSRAILKEPYISTVAVILSEVVKLVVSAFMMWHDFETEQGQKASFDRLVSFYHDVIVDSLPMAFPALCYFINNLLMYLCLQNLHSGTFAALMQTKLLTSAVFSVVLLGKHIPAVRWRALLLLVVGVVLVLRSSIDNSKAGQDEGGNVIMGVSGCLVSTTLSGLAGVFFEKMIKTKKNNRTPSVWTRNFQLAIYSIIAGYVELILVHDVSAHGPLVGFSHITWTIVFINALGGLLVGWVVKYADVIVKGFSTGAAIALSSFSSHFIFGTPLSTEFGLSTVVVVIAIFNYSDPIITAQQPHPANSAALQRRRAGPDETTHDRTPVELVVQARQRRDA